MHAFTSGTVALRSMTSLLGDVEALLAPFSPPSTVSRALIGLSAKGASSVQVASLEQEWIPPLPRHPWGLGLGLLTQECHSPQGHPWILKQRPS